MTIRTMTLLTLLALSVTGCDVYARNQSALKADEATGILLDRCRAGDDAACAYTMGGGGGYVGQTPGSFKVR